MSSNQEHIAEMNTVIENMKYDNTKLDKSI